MAKRVARTGCLLVAALAAAVGVVRAAEPSLPFGIKVTEEKIDPLPEYMGPKNPVDMDFPYCPVLIDGEYWVIYKNGYKAPVLRYKGTNIENAVRQPDGAAAIPDGAYILGGMWYDAAGKTLYAPLHYEVARYSGNVRREVHLASSTDKGLTWKYDGPLLTSDEDPGKRREPTTFSGLYWDGGDGDHVLYVDARGGYIYLYTNYYYWPKLDSPAVPLVRHRVAQCAIADKMASGKWLKFYDGNWSEPGVGGDASYVNGDVVIYDTYLKKYASINAAGGLSVCDDLSTQDWSESYYLGPYWFSGGAYGTWPTNEARNDVSTGGQTLYVYNFWEQIPGRRFRIEFGPGRTTAAGGFTPPGVVLPHLINFWSADPSQCYGYTPLFESADHIDARRTRRVGCRAAEVSYTGTWAESTDAAFYEGRAKVASDTGARIRFRFTGRDVYWRAAKGPDLGKAQVYLDDALAATVDCWANQTHPYQIAWSRRGLADGDHVVEVVVKEAHNPLSRGNAIKHMLFEYSAQTYRASDCFSSVAGKNRWFNQERRGTTYVDMTFKDPVWQGRDGCEVGYFRMTAGAGDAVRKWVAPSDGNVRVEGAPAVDGANPGVPTAIVQKVVEKGGDVELWSARLPTPQPAASAYDLRVAVRAGDAIAFIVRNSAGNGTARARWDPVVTYVR